MIILISNYIRSIFIQNFKLFFLLLLLLFLSSFPILSTERYGRVNAKNGLNMRIEPNRNSNIEYLLPPNSAVIKLEYSDKVDSIEGSRGYWVKVKYLDKTGWVFDPFLREANSKDPLINYMKYLENNTSIDLSSLDSARKEFKSIFLKNKKDSDNGFRLYRYFSLSKMAKFISKYEGQFENIQFLEKLNSNGIKVGYCEGEPYLIENYNYFNKLLKEHTTKLKDFINLMEKVGYPYACDAGISITWEEIRIRMKLIENYRSKNKFNPERNEVENLLNGYFVNYILGQDNTPVINFSKDKNLEKEVKKSYEAFLKYNKSSKYYEQLDKLYQLYKKNNFKSNNEIEKYLHSLIKSS